MGWGLIVYFVVVAIIAIAGAVTAYQAQQSAAEASKEAEKNARKFQIERKGTDQSLPVIYGTQELAPVQVLITAENYHGGVITNESLYVILVWCAGRVEAVEDLYIKGEKWRSGRFDPKINNGRTGYSGSLFHHHTGGQLNRNIFNWFTPSQNGADPLEIALGLEGYIDFERFDFSEITCTFLKLQMTEENPHWSKGYPEIKAKIKGRAVKDLRTGQIRYSENPALQLYDYMTNKNFGMDASVSTIDKQSFINAANHCDQQVTTPVGTQPLFSSNVILDTESTFKQNIDLMLGNFRGYLPPATQIKLYIEDAMEPVMTLNDDLIIGGITSTESNVNELYNQVVIRYPNKDNRYRYSEAVFPAVASALDAEWLAEDHGKRYTKEFTMAAITNGYEAMQMAEVQARLSRANGIVSLKKVMPECLLLEPLDVVALDDELRGWDKKPFRVGKIAHSKEGDVSLELIEYQANCYAWNDKQQITVPDTTHVVPNVVRVPAGLAFNECDDGLNQAKLSWVLVQDFWVKSYQWQILDAQGAVIDSGTTSETFALINNVPAGNLTARVRSKRVAAMSEWAVLPIVLTVPQAPTSCTIESTGGALRLFPQPKPLAFGAEFEFYASDAAKSTGLFLGRGISLSHNDLYADTVYHYKIRAANKYGKSTFLHVQGKTTLDQSALLQRLKDNLTTSELNPATRELFETLKTGTANSLPDSISALDIELDTAIVAIDIEIEKNKIDLESANKDITAANAEIEKTKDSIEAETLSRVTALNAAKNDLQATKAALEKNVDDAQSQLLEVTGNFANLQQLIEVKIQQQTHLINAVVDIDEANGTIKNKAYAYADNKFTEANLTIDGVKASVDINAKSLEKTDAGLQQAQSAISVQAGLIAQRATYSEINSTIASAIDALTPAYSWQFNDNAEGWTGVTQTAGYLVFINTTTAAKTGISFVASENPVIRARVKNNGTWIGKISNAEQTFTLTLPAPTTTGWEVVSLDASGATGYTGAITDLTLTLGDVDLDYLDIGKQGANDQELKDITARTTTIESEIDAKNARWSQYMTNTAFSEQAVTHANFSQVFDLADATYGLKALKAEIDTKGVISKATSAYDWIDLDAGSIGEYVQNYLAKDDGVNNRLNTVEQTADALHGEIKQSINSITGIEKSVEAQGADQVEKAFALHQLRTDQSIGNAKIAQAENTLQAQTNELEATASELLNLQTAANDANAQIQTLKNSVSNANKALAQAQSLLSADISASKDEAISTAQSQLETLEATLSTADQALSQRITDLNASFTQSLADETTATDSKLSTLKTTLSNADKAIAQSVTDLNASFTQSLADEATATDSKLSTLEATLSNADKAVAQSVTDLDTKLTKNVGDNKTASDARFNVVEQTQVDIDAAIAQQKTDLQTDYNKKITDETAATDSKLSTLKTTLSNEDKALAQSVTDLDTKLTKSVGDNKTASDARFATVEQAQVDTNQAIVQQKTAIEADYTAAIDQAQTDTHAKIDDVSTALSDAEKAIAQKQTKLQSVFNAAEQDASDQEADALEKEFALHQQRMGQSITSEKIALAERDIATNASASEAVAAEVLSLQSAAENARSQIEALKQSVSNANKALASSRETLSTEIGVAEAQALSQAQAQIDKVSVALSEADQALGQRITTLDASFKADIAAEATRADAKIQESENVLVNADTALAQRITNLDSKLDTETANVFETMRAESGYVCIDAHGKITDHKTAALCVAASGSWVQQSIAESLKSVSIATADGEAATLTQVMKAFRREASGDLTLMGGLVYDVNGRISGVVGTANGTNTDLEFIADKIKFVKPGTTDAVFEWDSKKNSLVFTGTIAAGSSIESPVIMTPEINIDPKTGSRLGRFSVNKHGVLRAVGAVIDSSTLESATLNNLTANKGTLKNITITNDNDETIFSSGGIDKSLVKNLGNLAGKDLDDLQLGGLAKTSDLGKLAKKDVIDDASFISLAAIQKLIAGEVIAGKVRASEIQGDIVKFGEASFSGNWGSGRFHERPYDKAYKVIRMDVRGGDDFAGKSLFLQLDIPFHYENYYFSVYLKSASGTTLAYLEKRRGAESPGLNSGSCYISAVIPPSVSVVDLYLHKKYPIDSDTDVRKEFKLKGLCRLSVYSSEKSITIQKL